MFAHIMILSELVFFAVALFVVLRNHADQYKVSKDIWGVYQQENPELIRNKNENMPVLIFSASSILVQIQSPDDAHDLKNPDSTLDSKPAA